MQWGITDPVFGGLSNEGTLITTRARVALNGVPSCPDEVVKFGKLYDERVPVVLVEGLLLEVFLDESGLELIRRLFLEGC